MTEIINGFRWFRLLNAPARSSSDRSVLRGFHLEFLRDKKNTEHDRWKIEKATYHARKAGSRFHLLIRDQFREASPSRAANIHPSLFLSLFLFFYLPGCPRTF